MNSAERVFAEILARRPGMHESNLARFLGVESSQINRWRRLGNMSDGALLVVHDRVGISVKRLLELRAGTLDPSEPRKPRRASKPRTRKTERERFEQWALADNRYTRRDGESYYDPVVAICWKAWKAALNQP